MVTLRLMSFDDLAELKAAIGAGEGTETVEFVYRGEVIMVPNCTTTAIPAKFDWSVLDPDLLCPEEGL